MTTSTAKKTLTAKQLRNDLYEVFNDLRQKKISVEECDSLSNTAGKINQSVLLDLKYRDLVGSKSNDFDFFKDDSEDSAK